MVQEPIASAAFVMFASELEESNYIYNDAKIRIIL